MKNDDILEGDILSNIIVAGAGHGGLTAAIKLAEAGHKVTVFEKNKRNECGYDQTDYFDIDCFKFAGFDIPKEFIAPNNQITFLPLEEDAPGITMPVEKNYVSLAANRRKLYAYLFDLCEKAGVELNFETEISGPVIFGGRVCGIETKEGRICGDLVIDACGVNSPIRRNLPEFMMIEKEYGEYDVLHTYRAYYSRLKEIDVDKTPYNLYLTDDGTVGLSWLVNGEENVDVLIARFHRTNFNDIENTLKMLRKRNPQMGSDLVSTSGFVDIPVRQTMPVFVADGYAAVGDSAFMTFPLKGSGIAYSITAGVLLAKTVLEDEMGTYNVENLWQYEVRYFEKIGFESCFLAIAKNQLPYLTAKELNDLFERKLITTEELDSIYSHTFGTLFSLKTIPALIEKIKVLNDFPEFRSKMADMLGWFMKFGPVKGSFPEKYDADEVLQWQEKYREFYKEIKKKN